MSNLNGEFPSAQSFTSFLKETLDLTSATVDCLRDEVVNKGPGPSAAKNVLERVSLSERIINQMMNNLTTNFAVTEQAWKKIETFIFVHSKIELSSFR